MDFAEAMDYSQMAGNPTHGLQQHYQELMAIQDPEELRNAALEIVKPYVGKGMSTGHYKKFALTITQQAQRGLMSVQKYISDFILAGSGMKVVESEVDVIANLLTEDASVVHRFTPEQLTLKALVEDYGFKVTLR